MTFKKVLKKYHACRVFKDLETTANNIMPLRAILACWKQKMHFNYLYILQFESSVLESYVFSNNKLNEKIYYIKHKKTRHQVKKSVKADKKNGNQPSRTSGSWSDSTWPPCSVHICLGNPCSGSLSSLPCTADDIQNCCIMLQGHCRAVYFWGQVSL